MKQIKLVIIIIGIIGISFLLWSAGIRYEKDRCDRELFKNGGGYYWISATGERAYTSME